VDIVYPQQIKSNGIGSQIAASSEALGLSQVGVGAAFQLHELFMDLSSCDTPER
jgi:hypothetical protein